MYGNEFTEKPLVFLQFALQIIKAGYGKPKSVPSISTSILSHCHACQAPAGDALILLQNTPTAKKKERDTNLLTRMIVTRYIISCVHSKDSVITNFNLFYSSTLPVNPILMAAPKLWAIVTMNALRKRTFLMNLRVNVWMLLRVQVTKVFGNLLKKFVPRNPKVLRLTTTTAGNILVITYLLKSYFKDTRNITIYIIRSMWQLWWHLELERRRVSHGLLL